MPTQLKQTSRSAENEQFAQLIVRLSRVKVCEGHHNPAITGMMKSTIEILFTFLALLIQPNAQSVNPCQAVN